MTPQRSAPIAGIAATVIAWTGLLVAALVLVRLLLPACGVYLPGAARPLSLWCDAPVVDDIELREANAEHARLEQAVRRAERDLLAPERCTLPAAQPEEHAGACPAGPALHGGRVVFVVDESNSMNLPAVLSVEERRELSRLNLNNRSDLQLYQELQERDDPTRMDRAREALREAVRTIEADAYQMIEFERCDVIHNRGPYSRADLDPLFSNINKLTPDDGRGQGSGTALAKAIATLPEYVSPAEDGSKTLVVVLTDGDDTCGGVQPCVYAQDIARSREDIQINVINIGGANEARCLADETGGEFIDVDDISQLPDTLARAAGAGC